MKPKTLQQKLKALKHRPSFERWAFKHVTTRLRQARIKPRHPDNAPLLHGSMQYTLSQVLPAMKREAAEAERRFKRHRKRSRVVRGVFLTLVVLIMEGLFLDLAGKVYPHGASGGFESVKALGLAFFPVLVALLSFCWFRPLLTCNRLWFLLVFLAFRLFVELMFNMALDIGRDVAANLAAEIIKREYAPPAVSFWTDRPTEETLFTNERDLMGCGGDAEANSQKQMESAASKAPESGFPTALLYFLLAQYGLMRVVMFSYKRLFRRETTLQQSLLARCNDSLADVWQKLIETLQALLKTLLLTLRQQYLEPLSRMLYERGEGCRSAGGIPASTEAHGLGLLSAHLSTFDVFASLFFPTGKHSRTGGGQNGLVPV